MSGKKLSIALKPGVQKRADAWVTDAATPDEVAATVIIKRLTIDVPEELHRRLKVKAAHEGVNMADLVRNWIEANV
jgi:predicted HicB family RNase H-like nuclease